MERGAVGGGNVPLPAEPDERKALLHYPFVAEIGSAAGIVEAAEHAFAAAVGDFEQHGSVALGGIGGLQDVEIGGGFGFAAGVETRQFEIAHDAVGWELGIHAEVHATVNAHVGAVEHGSAPGDFEAANSRAAHAGERQEAKIPANHTSSLPGYESAPLPLSGSAMPSFALSGGRARNPKSVITANTTAITHRSSAIAAPTTPVQKMPAAVATPCT